MDIRWLTKATQTSADFDPATPGLGGLLSPEQVKQFLRIAIESSILLSDARIEMQNATKFEVPRVSLASRILVPGTQGARVDTSRRAAAATGLMSLSTVLFKGELPLSDETFEDQIEREAYADTIMQMTAEAVGRDLEEILIKSDTARDPGGADPAADDIFDQLDGLIKRARSGITAWPAAHKIDAAALVTYDDLFAAMIEALPPRYRRNYAELRFYVPTIHKDRYQKSLSQRGTGLGDQAVVSDLAISLGYRGIPVKDIPLMGSTSTVNGAAIDYATFAFLTHPKNIVVGFQRRVRVEKWRDPREGVTSILPTVRVDTDWADPEASIIAYNVNIPNP